MAAMVNVPNSTWLRRQASVRRDEGWSVTDFISPDEMEALADQLDRLEATRLMCDARKVENERLYAKHAAMHRLVCEASKHFADGNQKAAASTIALAIRVGA